MKIRKIWRNLKYFFKQEIMPAEKNYCLSIYGIKERVMASYKFPNGMVATCGYDGQQISELQGPWSEKLEKRIRARSNKRTTLEGF